MKILIAGMNGLLGVELARLLQEQHEVTGLTKGSTMPGYTVHNADIGDREEVYRIITKLNPDLVINCAAMTNVDACEKDPDEAFRINALGPRNIALACQRFDAAMMQISTDYVFSGRERPAAGYTEFDPVDPISVYGRSKEKGEWYVRHLLNRFFIVRTSWLFGSFRSNFVTQIAESFRDGKKVNVTPEMVSAPTYVQDLAGGIARLIETGSFGVYHLTNSGFATREDVAEYISGLLSAPKSLINRISLKGLRLPAARPAFSGMRNYMFELQEYPLLRPWKEAVKEFLVDQKFM